MPPSPVSLLALRILFHPGFEPGADGGFLAAGDGHPGPAPHPELACRQLLHRRQVDHIGAVGLQKAVVRQQGLCHLRKGHPEGEGGHVLPGGKMVNHKLVPLSHKLNSGDQVEILTSKSQHVQPDWVNFVSTAKAKSKIMAILRRDSREVQKKGETILTDWLKKNNMEMTNSIVDKLCDFHNIQKHETFFQSIGEHCLILGEKDLDELQGKNKKPKQAAGWRNFIPFLGRNKSKEETAGTIKPQELFVVGKDFNKKKPLILTEENINQFIFPSCCHAIPGDDIMGFIDNKNRIEIHKRSCNIAAKLKSSYGNRIVDAKWDMHKSRSPEAVPALCAG